MYIAGLFGFFAVYAKLLLNIVEKLLFTLPKVQRQQYTDEADELISFQCTRQSSTPTPESTTHWTTDARQRLLSALCWCIPVRSCVGYSVWTRRDTDGWTVVMLMYSSPELCRLLCVDMTSLLTADQWSWWCIPVRSCAGYSVWTWRHSWRLTSSHADVFQSGAV